MESPKLIDSPSQEKRNNQQNIDLGDESQDSYDTPHLDQTISAIS